MHGMIDDSAAGLDLEANRATTLPISREELRGLQPLVIHLKCATSNRVLVQKVQQMAHDALQGARVDGHQLCVMVTTESVEMEAAELQKLAVYILPAVKQALGITGIQ